MNAVFEWVRGIVFYLILLTVVSHLVPGKKYEKYVRVFTGMLLVVIVIQPVRTFLDKDGEVDTAVDKIFQEEMSMDAGFTQRLEELPLENMEKELSGQMESFCSREASGLGLQIKSFEVEFSREQDSLSPVGIIMTVEEGVGSEDTGQSRTVDVERVTIPQIVMGEADTAKAEQCRQLRDSIAAYYGLSGEQIEIRGN